MLQRVFFIFSRHMFACVLLVVNAGARGRVAMVSGPNSPSTDLRIYRAGTLRKPDLTVWVISRFSHGEQGHEGEEIAAITGLRPASFLSSTEYNHFHNIKHLSGNWLL